MASSRFDSETPAEELAQLERMALLSEGALWDAANEQFPADVQARMLILMTKNNSGTISDDEYARPTAWVEHGDKLLLRKAYATRYLTGRGYKVTLGDLKPRDENGN